MYFDNKRCFEKLNIFSFLAINNYIYSYKNYEKKKFLKLLHNFGLKLQFNYV